MREGVRQAYTAIAEHPQEDPPFPTGRELAAALGYSPELLDELPGVAVEAFAGVSCVSLFAEVPRGASVLDLGCGAGLDTLIAARRVGRAGQVIGVDFSEAMLRRARQALAEAGATQVELRQGDAERLPLKDASVEIALVNGILNLNPARQEILCELARVLQPGGTAYLAELVLQEPLSEEERSRPASWFT
ncbi:MAG TPA: methyltransferase domain-containing protein [Armatimonadota bacterium]